MNRSLTSLILGTSLLGPAAAVAQEISPTAEDHAQLQPVVVIATRSPRPLADVAASVTVLDASQIADQIAFNPADLVRYQPALSVPRSGTRFGGGSYTIRGIGGNRVAIEIDGVPVADQFDIGSYSNAERDLVDLSVVQRVEILRGPASTLYGSDAIGGVVAYTTLDPGLLADRPLQIHGGYRSRDDSYQAGLTGAWNGDGAGALLALNQRQGGQVDSAARSGPEDRRDFDSRSAFGKYVATLSPRWQFSATAEKFEQDVDTDIRSFLGTGRFRSTTALRGDDTQRRERLSIRTDGSLDRSWADEFQVLAYHQSSDTRQFTLEERASRDLRRERWFDYQQRTRGLETNLQKAATWGGWEHRLGYGLSLRRTRTTEQRDGLQTDLAGGSPTRTMLGEVFPVRDFPTSTSEETALYLHDEISRAGSSWTLIPALRLDRYRLNPKVDSLYLEDNPDQQVVSLSESRWSPKLGLIRDLGPDSQLFAQYARGFRAPPFEDANIGLDIPLFNIRAIPNPDLKSETSDTLELGWRRFTRGGRLALTAHYSEYDDFIETKVRLGADPETGVILFQSRNIDAARIYGLELEWERALARDIQVTAALAWTRGRNDDTGNDLASVDPATAHVGLNWQSAKRPLSATLIATGVARKRGKAADPDAFVPAGFATIDLLARYSAGPAVLRAGLFNLTDRTHWRWADVRGLDIGDPLLPHLSAPGRNLGLSFAINW